jgi:glycosyltransferase involved in cell wall biosynthesis
VLLITGEYPPDEGGVADYTRLLAEGLATEGLTVDVLTGRGAAVPSADRRVTVHRSLPGFGWGLLTQVRRAVAALRPDVVHLQYQTAAFGLHPAVDVLPWWLRRTEPVKTAVTYHDVRVPYLFPKAGGLRRTVTLLPARWSHLSLATNAEDWVTLHDHGRPWRLALVPIGSNVPDAPPAGFERAAWRAAHGLPADAAVVAYFGFLNASKGGRRLVDLLGSLRRGGRDARLVMIGGRTGASDPTNAAYLAELEADLAAGGLDGSVTWTGHLPPAEVSAWLRAADVAALPYADGASFRRGSLLACLAHGVPVVTTRPAPLSAVLLAALPAEDRPPELVDGVHARLVPAADGPALAAAVGELLADPALARRIGDGGRGLASWFDWRRIAARHRVLYGEP